VLTVVLFLMTHYWVLCRLCHEGPLFFTNTHTHTQTLSEWTQVYKQFFSNCPPSALLIFIGRWRSYHGDTVATPIGTPPFCPIMAAALACVVSDWSRCAWRHAALLSMKRAM